MEEKRFWSQLALFVFILILILLVREFFSYQLIFNEIESYKIHMSLGIGANLVLSLVSILFIKKNNLLILSGINGPRVTKWHLLIFPVLYLGGLNALFLDDINSNQFISNLLFLIVYSISIGFSEELSIRGFLQSHLINQFGESKKNIIASVFVTAFFFGIIHLVNFDKGIFGEISQLLFASFIGIMFGALLLILKRIYPLIIAHAIIDFFAKLDKTGIPVEQKIADPMSIENAALSTLLVLPCLIYGIFLLRKFVPDTQTG